MTAVDVPLTAWPVELLSDMLRVVVLWWWGGVYSDTDVISVRSLTLPDNSLGFEHPEQLGSAFYSFQAYHPILYTLMKYMRQNFEVFSVDSYSCIYVMCKSRVIF